MSGFEWETVDCISGEQLGTYVLVGIQGCKNLTTRCKMIIYYGRHILYNIAYMDTMDTSHFVHIIYDYIMRM